MPQNEAAAFISSINILSVFKVGTEERRERDENALNKKKEEIRFLQRTIEEYKSQVMKLRTHIALLNPDTLTSSGVGVFDNQYI